MQATRAVLAVDCRLARNLALVSQRRAHHRPSLPGGRAFDELAGGPDPVEVAEAAERCAEALVRRSGPDDQAVVQRLVHLADTEGLETLAELWAKTPADTIGGSLWRLYLLRALVHNSPERAAAEFAAGRSRAGAAEVVAGVVDPPGPDEVRRLVDEILTGVATADFADALFRAAAFAHVLAIGRSHLHEAPQEAGRIATLSEQLLHAGRLELDGDLGPAR